MPTNTKQMYWDYNRHLYILEPEYVKNTLGYDLIEKYGSLTRAKDKMFQISRQISNFILAHASLNTKFLEWNLAFDDSLRPIIQEVLEWQTRYEFDSNVSELKKMLGVNPLNGIVIRRQELTGLRTIHDEAYLLLLNNGLLYTGRYRTNMLEEDFDYEEMGY